MKKIFKKLSALAILTVVANAAFSQVQWGVRAGVNFSNATVKAENISLDTKLNTGFHIGITGEFNLADEFYIQSGLLYSQKGYKVKTNIPMVGEIEGSVNLGYLELPINFVYKPELGNGKLLLGAGPYLAYGITGKSKSGGLSQDVEWGKDKEYKPFDAGAGFLVGYEFTPNIYGQLNAQLGLANGAPNDDSGIDTKYKNTVFGLSLGYKF